MYRQVDAALVDQDGVPASVREWPLRADQLFGHVVGEEMTATRGCWGWEKLSHGASGRSRTSALALQL